MPLSLSDDEDDEDNIVGRAGQGRRGVVFNALNSTNIVLFDELDDESVSSATLRNQREIAVMLAEVLFELIARLNCLSLIRIVDCSFDLFSLVSFSPELLIALSNR
jgi:hypothetical protein